MIQELIEEYEVGCDYTPLKVEMSVRPPIYQAYPHIFLDGIVSYLCLREALGEEFWTLPTHITIDIHNLQLPFKKTDDMNHASVGIYDKPQLKKDVIYKRFTDKETYHLNKKLQQGKIRTNAGYYKDFMINMPIVITDKIKFYCNADKYELKRLLGYLLHVGKKTSIGGGYINKIKISETDADYSFYKDGVCLKPTPAKYDQLPVKPNDKWKVCTYKPPYWDTSDSTLCRIPPNQLVGDVNDA